MVQLRQPQFVILALAMGLMTIQAIFESLLLDFFDFYEPDLVMATDVWAAVTYPFSKMTNARRTRSKKGGAISNRRPCVTHIALPLAQGPQFRRYVRKDTYPEFGLLEPLGCSTRGALDPSLRQTRTNSD